MSVVLALLAPNYVTLACDGRLSTRQPDGSLKPVGEFNKKIALLGGKAAIGITGSSTLSKILTEELDAAAREMPFGDLVEHARALAQKRLAEYSRMLVIEGVAILLAGFDGDKPRLERIQIQLCRPRIQEPAAHRETAALRRRSSPRKTK